MFLSAQASPQGIPKELLEAKKQELMQEKVWFVWRSLLGYADNECSLDGCWSSFRRYETTT